VVKKYKRSEKVRLSENFRLDEFKCKCGKCDPILVDEALVSWLQKIRDHFGKSVNINSGYRCAKHNADPKVGGSPSSHHVKGMAADIRVDGVTPEEVAKYAESIGIQRIGLYTKKSFVHIGSGTTKKFWLNDSNNVVDTFGGKPKTVTLELPVLEKGAKGNSVFALQTMLEGYGYVINADGSFGGKTENVLQCYQEDMDLKSDGVCDKATWSSLLGV
jgi:hypothetical protein